MNRTDKQDAILVLDAGESGLEVLRHLANHARDHHATRVHVLLRPSTI